MLRSLKSLLGYSVAVQESYIGELDDLLFDDQSWKILHAVVDVGDWLLGRKVLISPGAFSRPGWESHALQINMSKQEIERSPDLDEHIPVSRQHRLVLEGYYGWTAALGAEAVLPRPYLPSPIPVAEQAAFDAMRRKGNPCLRSAKEVMRYHTEGEDGEMGRMDDFLLDVERWEIVSLIVDTRKWLSGTKVLVSPNCAHEIAWRLQRVLLKTRTEQDLHMLHPVPQRQ